MRSDFGQLAEGGDDALGAGFRRARGLIVDVFRALDLEGLPAKGVGGNEIAEWVVGDVSEGGGVAAHEFHHVLVGPGMRAPKFAAERFAIEDVLEVRGEVKDGDFVLLRDEITVGDDPHAFAALEVVEEESRVVVEGERREVFTEDADGALDEGLGLGDAAGGEGPVEKPVAGRAAVEFEGFVKELGGAMEGQLPIMDRAEAAFDELAFGEECVVEVENGAGDHALLGRRVAGTWEGEKGFFDRRLAGLAQGC